MRYKVLKRKMPRQSRQGIFTSGTLLLNHNLSIVN